MPGATSHRVNVYTMDATTCAQYNEPREKPSRYVLSHFLCYGMVCLESRTLEVTDLDVSVNKAQLMPA
jgi:hypothetical protein